MTATIARVFIADGTVADVNLGDMTWDQFIHSLILHNAVLSADAWINRQGITKIIRAEVEEGFQAPNVLHLVKPEGTA